MKCRCPVLLFDLDGTLSDPAQGIISCLAHALRSLPPDTLRCAAPLDLSDTAVMREQLAWCIGPPLRSVLSRLLRTSDSALIERAVALFRERFAACGLYENKVYAGIAPLLAQLHTEQRRLFLSTSKPRVFAERILDHFELSAYFEGVYGPDLTGRGDCKIDLVRDMLQELALDYGECALIGDRAEDMAAAKKNAMTAIGVTYGYGSEQELRDAGADYICDSVRALHNMLAAQS